MNNECQIIEPLLAAYALDALDPDEREQVEAHLETCDSCQQTLAEYRAVSDELLLAVKPVDPPARLRAQLLARTAQEEKQPVKASRWRIPNWGWVSMVGTAVLLILLVFNISLMRRTNQLLSFQDSLVQQNQAYQTAFALMSYPTSQVAVIDDGTVYGTIIYDPQGRVAVMNVWGLGALSEDQVYQIWLIQPDDLRVSGGVFDGSDDVAYVSVVIESPQTFNSFEGIGITIEPEGGSPGPTGPRIVGVDL